MSIAVGEVVAVSGVRITLKVFDESNKDTLFYNGEKYKGISIREYIYIRRGFKDIVCLVEGEYLDEGKMESRDEKVTYVRRVEVKPIGYFDESGFHEGVKYLPMIRDVAYLLKEGKIKQIYGLGLDEKFVIGEMLKEGLPAVVPWQRLFNSHIGIFGNTGSGKSNTLAKLYTTLFDEKLNSIRGKSKFVVIDFNGEYANGQMINGEDKRVLNLVTRTDYGDVFALRSSEFWDVETLSILFQATPNTQRPFINRLVSGRERYMHVEGSLGSYVKSTFRLVFVSASPRPDTLDLLRRVSKMVGAARLSEMLDQINWHSNQKKFVGFDAYFDANGDAYDRILATHVNQINVDGMDSFDELLIRADVQLVRDILNGFVQFDFIQPLIKRIEASLSGLRRVVRIDEESIDDCVLTVISLRGCNQEAKKVLPLLIAKHYYNKHKYEVSNPPNKTMHMVIDEAHNILSQQSL